MSRFHGIKSQDEDEDDEDDYDMSGFVSDQVPPVIERPRTKAPESPPAPQVDNISYAGPTTRVRTGGAPASSINYAPNFISNVPDAEAGTWRALNPIWAADSSWVSPKLHVFLKTAGISVAMITTYPALSRGLRGKSGKAFAIGSYAYLMSATGMQNGLADKLLSGQEWYINYPSKAAVQGILAYTAFRLIKRA